MDEPKTGVGDRPESPWPDRAWVIVLLVVVAASSWLGSQRLGELLLHREATNVWFEADPDRIFQNLTDRWSDHWRQAVHPLFSLLVCLPVTLLTKVLPLETVDVVRAFYALAAGGWIVLFYVVLRALSLRPLDAGLFSLVLASSAAARFWLVLPETYVFGSASLLFVVLVAARAGPHPLSLRSETLASVLAFAFTITNWMGGLLLHFGDLFSGPHRSLRARLATVRRGLLRATLALALVCAAWLVQSKAYPTAKFFGHSVDEVQYLSPEGSGGPGPVLRVLFGHSLVMPEIERFQKFEGATYPYFSVQRSPALARSGSGLVGCVGVIAAWALVAWGVVCLFRERASSRPPLVVLGLLLGQCVLHVLYGDETFLYTLHIAPLLVLAAAYTARGRAVRWARILGVVWLSAAALNNQWQFSDAANQVHEYAVGRGEVGAP